MARARGAISLLLAALAAGCQVASVPISPRASTAPAEKNVNEQIETWLAFGDSITFDAFVFRDSPGWEAPWGGAAPQAVNAGYPGATSLNAVQLVDRVIADHPEAGHVGVAFGTNDCFGDIPVETFKTAMRTVIQKLRSSGKQVMLSTIPWSPHERLRELPAYNAAILELQGELALPAGPDLYGWFKAHPDEISSDQVHPGPVGQESIRRLWAEAAAR